MRINFKKETLQVYLEQLSSKAPVPGGGSAGALSAALGAGLVSMVTNYSIGRKGNGAALDARLCTLLKANETMRLRLLDLISLDSAAYLNIVAARKLDVKARKKAAQEAHQVGTEVCRLCYKVVQYIPFLVNKGNPYLLSDLEAAAELLMAGFNTSLVFVKLNDPKKIKS